MASKLKTVIAVERCFLLTGASRTGYSMTLHWRCTLECGHKRLQSAMGRSSHSDKMKCKAVDCG